MTYSRTWGAKQVGTLEDLERTARKRPLDGTEKASANALLMFADTDDHRARAQRILNSQESGEQFDPVAQYRQDGGRR